MARVKNGAVTKARRKKILKEAKGYFGSKHRLFKTAKEQVITQHVEKMILVIQDSLMVFLKQVLL